MVDNFRICHLSFLAQCERTNDNTLMIRSQGSIGPKAATSGGKSMPVRQSCFAVRNSFPLPLKKLHRNHAVEATHTSLRPLGSAVLLLLLLLALSFEGPPQG